MAVCSLISTLPPQSMRNLALWPLMTKNMLRQHLDDLVADDVDVLREWARHRLSVARTSGATGEQMRVLVDLDLAGLPGNARIVDRLWAAPSMKIPLVR